MSEESNDDFRSAQSESVILREEFIRKINERSRAECDRKSSYVAVLKGQTVVPDKEAREVLPELTIAEFYKSPGDEEFSEAGAKGIGKGAKKKREANVFAKGIHSDGRYVVVVGEAGSGKTTLSKRYCSLALNNKTSKSYKMVHFINMRDTSSEDKISPKEFLFKNQSRGMHLEKCVAQGYKWLQEENSQDSVLLIFDGFDTAPWDLKNADHPKMSYLDKEGPATIMSNILSGHLFGKCDVLVTSRESAVSNLLPHTHPDVVIAIKGLALRDIKTLVEDLGDDQAFAIWTAIIDKSQNLMELCSNPLFLTLLINIFKYEQKPPKTFSGVIIGLIQRHIRSTSKLMDQKEFERILHKLKNLSYKNLLRGSVVFSEKEMKDAGLIPKDIDLIIGGPMPNDPNAQRLLPKDYGYFFCHQAFQEAFAAQYIAEMEEQDFNAAVDDYLFKPQGILVRHIVCGILFNNETSISARSVKIIDQEKKRKKILEVLIQDLKNYSESPKHSLNILISLRECGQDPTVISMVKDNVKAIRLWGIPLTPSDLHAIGTVASWCDKLNILQLVDCQLERRALEILVEVMQQSDVEITVFDVSFNNNLRKDSMYHVHKICIRGQGLNYWQCGFRQHHILNFVDKDPQDAEKEIEIESTQDRIRLQYEEDNVLDFESYNVQNHFDMLKELTSKRPSKENLRINVADYGMELKNQDNDNAIEKLCDLLEVCQDMSELAISVSALNETQGNRIAEAVRHITIPTLNIYLCPTITSSGWSTLGKLASFSHVQNLFITACGLEQDKLQKLKQSLLFNQARFRKLDISRNMGMHPNCLSEIGEIIESCGTKDLIMAYCDLEFDHLKPLKEKLITAKLDRIDASGNDRISPEGYKVLGEIVTKCQTKQLDISECDPKPTEIEQLKNATEHAQLKKLNISRNRNIGSEGMRHVAQMTGQYTLDELFIRQCELDEEKLRSFLEALPDDAQIIHLELGLYFMRKKPTSDGEIDILIKILPKLSKKLTLSGWDLNEDMKKQLEHAINELEFKNLQIVFDRGLNEIVSQKSSNK